MNISQIREMRSRLREIEHLENDGMWKESDQLWDEMLKIASPERKMRRQAIAGAGWLPKLLKWFLPMWREEAKGVSRFVSPSKNVRKILQGRYTPFTKTIGKEEVSVPWKEAWDVVESTDEKSLFRLLDPEDVPFVRSLMKGKKKVSLGNALRSIGIDPSRIDEMEAMGGDAFLKHNNVSDEMRKKFLDMMNGQSPVDIDTALEILKRERGKDYFDRMIHLPGWRQKLRKGALSGASLAGVHGVGHNALDLDKVIEGEPAPSKSFEQEEFRGMRGETRPHEERRPYDPYGYSRSQYARQMNPHLENPYLENPYRRRDQYPPSPYQPSSYQVMGEDTRGITDWAPNSVSGVVMDPYGEYIMNTIPS